MMYFQWVQLNWRVKLLNSGLGKKAKGKGRKGFTVVLFTVACILGSAFPLPLISSLSSSTAIAQTRQDRKAEGNRLFREGFRQLNTSQFQAALQSFQQALEIYQQIGDRQGEAYALFGTGRIYSSTGQYQQALKLYQYALSIFKDKGYRVGEGTTLNSIGMVYYRLGQYPQALDVFQQVLVIRQEVGEYPGETLNNIGLVYADLGQYPQALASFQQALAIAKNIGNRPGECTTLNNIGTVYRDRGQYSQALESFQQALVISREIGDRAQEGIVLAGIGGIYDDLGQYKQALDTLGQALVIAKDIGDRLSEGNILNNIAAVYADLGQYRQALDFYQQALAIAKAIGDRPREGNILAGIGGIHNNLGQYPQALDALRQALAISKEVGNRSGEGTALNAIGTTYESLGQYQQALDFYQQALTVRQEIGERATEAANLSNIGGIYNRLGQYSQALYFYQKTLTIQQEIGERLGEGITLNNIGGVYIALRQYRQALDFFQQALSISKEIGDRAGEGMTLGNVGGVYIALGQYSQALDFYRQALTILRDTGNRKEEGGSLSLIGLALFQTNRLAAAEEALFESVKVRESLRASELSDADKVALFETEVSNNKLLQQVLIAQNKTEVALEVAERGRARVFVEQLATKLSESQLQAILFNAPNLAAIRRIAQQQNATLIEYSVIDSRVGKPTLYIWVIQPTGEIHFQAIDLSILNRSLNDLVTTSREAIGVRNRSELATIVPELKPEAQRRQQAQQRQKLQKLHLLLIEPIAQYLPTNPDERVIFIPQGELFLVPFPALVDAQGKYLIEKHTILTVPSIQVLDLTRQKRQLVGTNNGSPIRGDDVLVVGNPIMPKVWNPAKGIQEQLSSLPGAEEEAATIAKAFATKPLLWEQASESAVVQRMPQARIIHLSTHGLLEYGNPQDSGVRDFPGAIALSPSAKDDGLLTSAEILQMKLKAELVVLSACDTGRGRITGDGVIGLSRSLITAGVPSVIVSLWSVPDAPTADLMSEFYRQWQQNPDKAKALRQAMLITMQNHPNPRDWAAFTLIGESE